MALTALIIGLAMMAVTGCADVRAVERAADAYVAPEDFVFIEAETFSGFEAVAREFSYHTDLRGSEACEVGRRSLEEWAGAAPELWERDMRGLVCAYRLFAVPNFPELDYAAVHVTRSVDRIPSSNDSNRPDVVVIFSIDK